MSNNPAVLNCAIEMRSIKTGKKIQKWGEATERPENTHSFQGTLRTKREAYRGDSVYPPISKGMELLGSRKMKGTHSVAVIMLFVSRSHPNIFGMYWYDYNYNPYLSQNEVLFFLLRSNWKLRKPLVLIQNAVRPKQSIRWGLAKRCVPCFFADLRILLCRCTICKK